MSGAAWSADFPPLTPTGLETTLTAVAVDLHITASAEVADAGRLTP